MIDYVLWTAVGHEHFLVKRGKMPKFSFAPDTVCWKGRVFMFRKREDGEWHYLEVFNFVVLED